MTNIKATAANAANNIRTLAEAESRCAAIGARRKINVAERVRLFDAGVKRADEVKGPPIKALAAALLNATGSIVDTIDDRSDSTRLRDLEHELLVIDEALRLGAVICTRLAHEEAAARVIEHRPAHQKIMRRIAMAAIEIEHALQERDELLLKMRPPYNLILPGDGFPLLGRTVQPSSQSYRFLAAAAHADAGVITTAELARELKRARAIRT